VIIWNCRGEGVEKLVGERLVNQNRGCDHLGGIDRGLLDKGGGWFQVMGWGWRQQGGVHHM
jgi:hypothetical protein